MGWLIVSVRHTCNTICYTVIDHRTTNTSLTARSPALLTNDEDWCCCNRNHRQHRGNDSGKVDAGFRSRSRNHSERSTHSSQRGTPSSLLQKIRCGAILGLFQASGWEFPYKIITIIFIILVSGGHVLSPRRCISEFFREKKDTW